MKERVVSAIVYAALVLAAIALGGWYYIGILGVMGLICAYEYAHMMQLKGHSNNILFVICGTALLMLGSGGVWDFISRFPYLVLVPLPVLLFCEMRRANGSIESGFFAWVGMVYLGLNLGCLLHLESFGALICLLAFLIVWANDIGAFFVGCAIGKHKLAPRVSPQKSVEGAVGGALLCFIVCFTYNYFFLHLPVLQIVLIAVLCSVMSQFGDLCESYIKRYAGVKDSGNIMPGHGGLFDRLDSIVLVAPVLLFLLSVF